MLAAACTAALLAAGCGRSPDAVPDARLVRTVLVDASDHARSTTYTAEIRSRYEADMSFQVGGKLYRRGVDVGSPVRKGTVMAQLDPTDQQLGVNAARSAVNAALAELNRARAEEARYRDLLERGLTTRAAYLAQQTAVKTSQSAVDQTTAELQLNQQKLRYTSLVAEQDGVVTRVLADIGTVMSPGQTVLTVASPGELEAVFDVPDGQIEAVRQATVARISLLSAPAKPFDGHVREISPSADPTTRTYQVKTSIPSPPSELRLGMTVAVELPDAQARAGIPLPATALFQKDRSPAVWVVGKDLKLMLRPVTVDRYEADRVVVTKGLANGERVVTAGVHRLAAGELVRLMSEGTP
jgi:RND family efflux transporter MFP subunit